jgi:hypothetical protein
MYCDGCAKSEGQAVKAERENLALRAEIAALKARLAEAEKALEKFDGGRCPSCGFPEEPGDEFEGWIGMKARAEAAERELAGYKHMLSMAHEQRDINRDRAEQSERKCAELSERLAMADRLISYAACVKPTANTDEWAAGLEQRCDAYMTKYAADGWAFAALASQPAPEAKPMPLVLYCPVGHLHVDKGEWATRPHKTHQCQARIQRFVCLEQDGSERYDAAVCGLEWRPADFPTVGVKPTPEAQ